MSAVYFCQLFCWKFAWSSTPYLSLLLYCAQSTSPSLLWVLFSSLFIILFSLWGGGQSVQRALLVYPSGDCGSTACHLFAHLLVCFSQAGLQPISGGTGALLACQCNVAWSSFVWAGGSECWSFPYGSFFFFYYFLINFSKSDLFGGGVRG
jgi:hypothetical protein